MGVVGEEDQWGWGTVDNRRCGFLHLPGILGTPRHGVALSGKGKGVQLGVNGGPLLAVCCGGPFPELCVVVQPRGVPELFYCLYHK